MAVVNPEQKIEKACLDAKVKLESLGIEEKIQAELDYVIGSYNFDKNPIGLYEIGGYNPVDSLTDYDSFNAPNLSKNRLGCIS